ncbi:molybdenum cofactor guanylyltransferase [Oceanirhabdus seepicola]|uniref:Probable molybdenum cofactor guanylyltransferase n=1 Tax=Oceanirhabdus seepicola TaxID=2828781 RepID=A0A9J6NWQ2_9CLOT|nr:molybdenum cofactor guanylyltransferase [Oceanirhabdus seepicola]MCM1988874.1 molybdenum cofactor guanylyltransferase [Oceanirhabdus seepicola]
MNKLGSAVILCGGKSSRMGFDKSKIKINDTLLLDITAESLEEIFDEIILVTDKKEKFRNSKYTIIEDSKKNCGSAEGIYTGLKYASSEYVFVLACDMPVISIEYIKYMMTIIKNNNNIEGVISKNGKWIEPMHSFYSKNMLPHFKEALDQNKLKISKIIENGNMHYIEERIIRKYSKDLNIFINLNYIEDLSILNTINYKGKKSYGHC